MHLLAQFWTFYAKWLHFIWFNPWLMFYYDFLYNLSLLCLPGTSPCRWWALGWNMEIWESWRWPGWRTWALRWDFKAFQCCLKERFQEANGLFQLRCSEAGDSLTAGIKNDHKKKSYLLSSARVFDRLKHCCTNISHASYFLFPHFESIFLLLFCTWGLHFHTEW